MTDRIRSRHGNVIAADFRPRKTVGRIEIPLSVETVYTDDRVVVMRCTVGTHTWHLLGDIATGNVIST